MNIQGAFLLSSTHKVEASIAYQAIIFRVPRYRIIVTQVSETEYQLAVQKANHSEGEDGKRTCTWSDEYAQTTFSTLEELAVFLKIRQMDKMEWEPVENEETDG